MSVVDDGSAAHWTADRLSVWHRGKSLAAIVCWFTEASPSKWNPMTIEFGGVHLRPRNKTSNNGVSSSPRT